MASAKVEQTPAENSLPKLNLTDKVALLRGAVDLEYFKKEARPRLYARCWGDPETVHDVMLHTLHEQGRMVRLIAPFFRPPKNLTVKVNGVDIVPFGTAAGMDKDGEAFEAFGYIFGFQEPGTVVVDQRSGKDRVRVAMITDDHDLTKDIVNADGFPSKGLDYFLANISGYRNSGGKAKIYVSVCGLPLSDNNGLQTAMKEMHELLNKLKPYADGFVWNPSCENVGALKLLMNPKAFRETAKLMLEVAPDALKLVKIGAYEPNEKGEMLQLFRAFMEGGGHGVVTANAKRITREQLPKSVRDGWIHESAALSGSSLGGYRMRSVKDMRKEFPDSVIIGTGGIDSPYEAYETLRYANMIEGYAPYAYFGTGFVRTLMNGVADLLERNKFGSLAEMQAHYRSLLRKENSS